MVKNWVGAGGHITQVTFFGLLKSFIQCQKIVASIELERIMSLSGIYLFLENQQFYLTIISSQCV